MKRRIEPETANDPVGRYVAGDASQDYSDGVERIFAGSSSDRNGDGSVFARCDTVLALAPKLAESGGIAWAFDEAAQLARSGPKQKAGEPPAVRWYRNPGLAWTVAAVFAAALVFVTMPQPPEQSVVAEVAATDADRGAAMPVANVTFAPIVISTELARTLAEVEPVVTLANGAPVDSRSLAVLPFAQSSNTASSSDAAAAASIYEQVVRSLSAYPGLLLIDPSTAAIYSNSELTPEEIALQLGVRGVVQGRIDAFNGDIRFDLQFTDAAMQGLSMNAAIERPSTELAMLQSDITSSVLGALANAPSIGEVNDIL